MPNKRLVTNFIGQGESGSSADYDDDYSRYTGEEETSSKSK